MGIRRASVVCSFSFLLAVLIGCAGVPEARLVTAEQLQSAGYYKYWAARLPLAKSDGVENFYLVDENLYVTTRLGHLYCVSAEEGLLRWTTSVTEPDYTIFRPSHIRTPDGNGPVVIVTTTRTYIFDRYSGDLISSFTPSFSPGAGAVGDERRLYMGGADGRVYAMQWKHPFGGDPIGKWELMAGGPVTATPSLYGEEQLIFASQGGAVVSCSTFDKSCNWARKTEDAVVADPFVDETGVYVAGTDRSLYRFDVNTGAQRWRYRFPKPLVDPPAVARFTCYQSCPQIGLTAIDVDSGERKWVRPDGASFVAGGFGEAVIFTNSGAIEIVDTLSGQTTRSFDAKDTAQVVCNTRDDRVILATNDGHLTCARPESIPYLKRQQVMAAQHALTSKPDADRQARERQPLPPPLPESSHVDVLRSERDTQP